MSSARALPLVRVTKPRAPHTTSHHRPRISPSPFHYGPNGPRCFHWQSAAGTAIDTTQSLILGLHGATGLPWFLTIPLVALAVGTVARLPFSAYNQRILRHRAALGPVLQAWSARIQRDVHREGVAPGRRLAEARSRQDRATNRIYGKLGLQQWRLYGSTLGFPVWLLAIDAVRRLCGGPRGLLGSLIMGAPSGPAETAAAATTGTVADSAALDAGSAAVGSVVETVRTAVVDASLTYEGCLWFTDLTVSDPYHILPLALSAALTYNLVPKTKSEFTDRVRVVMGRLPKSAQAQTLAGDEKVAVATRAQSTLYLAMVGLAVLVGPLTMDLPAALHLYWLSSSLTNALFAKGLSHFMPVGGRLLKRCTGVELPLIRPQRVRQN
ncbi:hypothetical protein F4802DRAFT_423735 [Xylaria palmicola]|nr:hypothetical protein F4802DRAFT_423735 [Xylaria palmicola]